jgi:hypothetical protein
MSYRHMAGLLASWGEDTLSAYLGPLAVDGLMILAAAGFVMSLGSGDLAARSKGMPGSAP